VRRCRACTVVAVSLAPASDAVGSVRSSCETRLAPGRALRRKASLTSSMRFPCRYAYRTKKYRAPNPELPACVDPYHKGAAGRGGLTRDQRVCRQGLTNVGRSPGCKVRPSQTGDGTPRFPPSPHQSDRR